MSTKRFAEEFKAEAVKQVLVGGHRVADVAARLGVSQHSLYAWIKRRAFALPPGLVALGSRAQGFAS